MEYLITNSDKHIIVTNDTEDFFEKKEGDIYIYGAGLCGYWIGYYLDLCEIKYEGYIDRSWQSGEYKYNGKDMHPMECIKNSNQTKRIIISPNDYSSVIRDLLLSKGKIDCICLLPVYQKSVASNPSFDINILLGYFRRKSFKGEIPTILSNDCTAGVMYRWLNLPFFSPTINLLVKPGDFIKLCKNPKMYLNQDVTEYFFEREYRNALPDEMGIGFHLNDISVHLVRLQNAEDGIKKWNERIKRINWERVICVYDDNQYVMSYDEMKEFQKVQGRKLLILSKLHLAGEYGGDMLHVTKNPFFSPEVPLERDFDFLSWINE